MSFLIKLERNFVVFYQICSSKKFVYLQKGLHFFFSKGKFSDILFHICQSRPSVTLNLKPSLILKNLRQIKP